VNRVWWNPLRGDHFNVRSLRYVNRFVPSGYAWVTVDVRGTGASGGFRPVDFSPVEVADYPEVGGARGT
jgi:uncharacterized protein